MAEGGLSRVADTVIDDPLNKVVTSNTATETTITLYQLYPYKFKCTPAPPAESYAKMVQSTISVVILALFTSTFWRNAVKDDWIAIDVILSC